MDLRAGGRGRAWERGALMDGRSAFVFAGDVVLSADDRTYDAVKRVGVWGWLPVVRRAWHVSVFVVECRRGGPGRPMPSTKQYDRGRMCSLDHRAGGDQFNLHDEAEGLSEVERDEWSTW